MALQHTRSRSFPSGSPPSIIQVDGSLLSESTTPSTLSSVTYRIKGLENLYENINDLLLLPHVQRIIAQEYSRRCVDGILDGYIMLLDACAAAKDLISLAKKDAQELLSAVRRRSTHTEASYSYLTSRRKLRKMVEKALKASSFRKKQVSEKGCETGPVVDLLVDAQSATSAMLKSLFSCMIRTKVQSRQSSKSLMSKLVDSKKVSSQDEQTEFSKVDTALLSFTESKTSNEDDVKVDDLLNCLKEMESSIQILEDGLECLFRQLIKTRVLLLNILSH